MAERNSDSWNISARYQKYNFILKNMQLNASLSHTWDHSLTVDTAYRKYYWDGGYIVSQRNEDYGQRTIHAPLQASAHTMRTNLDYQLNTHHSFNLNYHLSRTGNDRFDDLDTSFEPSKDVVTKHILGLSYNQSLLDGKMENVFFIKDYSTIPISGDRTIQRDRSKDVQGSTTKNYLGYGAGLRYIIVEPLSIKVSYEHSVRLPIARELLGNGTTIYANVALKPENSNNFNASLFGTWHPGNGHTFYYEMSGFFRKVDNYIQTSIAEKEGTMQYTNVPAVHVKGAEGEMRYDWQGRLPTRHKRQLPGHSRPAEVQG